MAIEEDRVRITGGVMAGRTTGAPISMTIVNKDFAAWVRRDVNPMTIPRPGHADLNAALKYGYRDLRLGLERASARETAARVAMGAVCRQFLQNLGIVVGSYVLSISSVRATISADPDFPRLFSLAEASPVRCPDQEAAEKMREEIASARSVGDTLGGVFDCVALNLPPGLGSHVHWDRRLTARLMAAVGSIPAIKGVQFGNAFGDASRMGTDVHDEIVCDAQRILRRATNRAGGVEGGMTTGEPLIVRAAMKPISTTLKGLGSVDMATGEPARTIYERSDVCAVSRACVVAEAMVSFVLADALIEKLGGDSLEEMAPRYTSLRRGKIGDLPVDNTTWRFGYKLPNDI